MQPRATETGNMKVKRHGRQSKKIHRVQLKFQERTGCGDQERTGCGEEGDTDSMWEIMAENIPVLIKKLSLY